MAHLSKLVEQERTREGLRILARYQGHWVERIVLPLLTVVFTVALLSLWRVTFSSFFPSVSISAWMLVVGGAACFENVYMAPLMVKARAPFSLRFLDFFSWIAVAYTLLRLALAVGTGPFLSWDAWKRPEICLPLGLVGFSWYLGGSFGKEFLYLGSLADQVGDVGAGVLPWEQEAIMSEYTVDQGRVHAMTEFTRRVLFYPMLFSLAAAIASEVSAAGFRQAQGWSGVPTVSMAVLLLSGLALQGYVYLYRLQTIWRKAQVKPVKGLVLTWSKSLSCLLALALTFAVLVPAGLSPISFDKLMRWLSSVGSELFAVQSVERLPSVNSVTVYSQPNVGELGIGEPSSLGVFSLLFLLVQIVIIAFAFLVVIGFCVVTFAKSERERFAGLLRIPVLVYLWAVDFLFQVVGILSLCARRGSRIIHNRAARLQQHRGRALISEELRRGGEQEPSEVALYIRYLFLRLLRTAAAEGYGPRASQTPREYSASLAAKLDHTVSTMLHKLTSWYTEARYSNHSLPESLKAEARKAAVALEHALSQAFGPKGSKADGQQPQAMKKDGDDRGYRETEEH